MENIASIDHNFKEQEVSREGMIFRNGREQPFRIYGLLEGVSSYLRIPEEVAEATGERIAVLNRKTAGGRIRFRTDSPEIALRVTMPTYSRIAKMTCLAGNGYDMYSYEEGEYRYVGSFVPPVAYKEPLELSLSLPPSVMRDITINLPIFGEISRLEVGLREGAALLPPEEYRTEAPILYYGSSITQGQCVSRPGNIYEAIISRRFHCDYRNLGWSGNAKGDLPMAEYISRQPMSLFVMDYDHNSPTAETLMETHERFFLTVRERRPELPILMTTKTDTPYSRGAREALARRREVIRRTYDNAVARGDKNVYFVDGSRAFGLARTLGLSADDCTIDGCHPTDVGYACMAKLLGDKIGEILGWTSPTQ